MKAKLILVDGSDYSGKTTTVEFLSLLLQPHRVHTVRFPGYGDLGKVTRPYFLSDSISEETKLQLILAEFSLFLEDFHNGKFDEYDAVICDRFVLSTVHQTCLKPELVDVVKRWLESYPMVYQYFVLKTSPEVTEQRHSERAEFNAGDLKAMREFDVTDFFAYADQLGLSNTVKIVNSHSKDHLYEEIKKAL